MVVRISLIAQFFNAFLLGTAGGDVIKAWYAARSCPNQEGEAAVTVFVDRLLGTRPVFMIAFGVLGVIAVGLTIYYRYQAASAAEDAGKPWARRAA